MTTTEPTYRDRLRHLAAVGRRMRDAQKRFFDTKLQPDLVEAKRLEREFDAILREEEQPRLFEPADG